MPDISKITLPSGTTYDIKDTTARTAIAALQAGGLTYVIADTLPTAGVNTLGNIYLISQADGAGDHFYKEYLTVAKNGDHVWEEIGDTKIDLSGYATKGGAITATGSATAAASNVTVGNHTVTQGNVNATGKFTPAGTVGVGTGTANYTPAGTITGGVITVTPSTSNKFVAASATGGGSVAAGTAARCTLPVLTTTVSQETLSIGWTGGSFTANTPTAVTLPSFTETTVATGIQSAAITTAPTFAGTGVQLAFTGTQGDVNVSGKTTGVAVSAHAVTNGTHTHNVSVTGTIDN